MLDLNGLKKVYVIGITGSGIIAIVEILHSRSIKITGSDTDEIFFSNEILEKLGIQYIKGFEAKNIPTDADLILYSTAWNEKNNPEIAEAKKRNLPMLSYPEIMAELFNQKYGLAVTGTHGKTTTSALLAEVLRFAGTDPSAVIGSKVIGWKGNALSGRGEYFVLEADEYQNKLRLYDPEIVILTNCDFDHPDYFSDFSEYKEVFKKFTARIPKSGVLVVWGDSTDTIEVSNSAKCDILTYGFGEECDYKSKIKNQNEKLQFKMQNFEIEYKGKSLGEFKIQLVGKHNVLNATAVIALCHKLNIDLEKAKEALRSFQGTVRRFQKIGERNGAILIDDYGHHPEEIKATLRGANELYPEKNIKVVFHPHTFTRTKALLHEFSQSFSDADEVIVLDIYGSARETQGGVHSEELVKLINQFTSGKAKYIPTVSEAVEYLKDRIGENDIVIAMGAGNVWEVAEKLKEI